MKKHIEDVLPQNHPEQHSDEYFVGNYPKGSPGGEYKDFQTKEFGVIAYHHDGTIIPNHSPLFVSTVEYDKQFEEVKIGQ